MTKTSCWKVDELHVKVVMEILLLLKVVLEICNGNM